MESTWAEAESEILVHAAAPSRPAHDAWYRTLAGAYLGFQPARTIHLGPPALNSDAGCPSASDPPPLGSPQLSFASVWDNAGSPLPAAPPYWRDEASISGSHLSWTAPPSEIEDSQPLHHVRLGPQPPWHAANPALCKSARPGARSVTNASSLSTPHKLSGPDRAALPRLPGEAGEARLTEPYSAESPLLLPSPSGLPSPSLPSASRLQETEATAVGPGPGPGCDDDGASLSSRADSEPPTAAKRSTRLLQRRELLTKSFSDISPNRHADRSRAGAFRQVTTPGRFEGALQVFAPEPNVSHNDLEPCSLLTSNLIKLEKDLDLPRRYLVKRLLLQGREPRPTERGFWELACADWDIETKTEAWAYLSQYIGQGRAGWGVWLKRDAATNAIRLFSFGHAAGHMYLLLYTASRRRILSIGCTWTSGADALVLVPATKDGWEV